MVKLDTLVIATHNAGKLQEIQDCLAPLQLHVVTQASLNIAQAEEPHCTFVENALAKARHASFHSGLPALADDSGLCVDVLNGAPGVYSARYASEDPQQPTSDAANNAKLLNALAHETQRDAYYYCVMVFVKHAQDPQPIIAEGIWRGKILSAPRGDGGFGYDPLFLDVSHNQSAAELTKTVKNIISHRGQALRQLLQKLNM
jgi:XTP/dITP diphosphohydrolase